MHRDRNRETAMTIGSAQPHLAPTGGGATARQRLRDVLSRAAAEARHVHDGLASLDACLGGVLGQLPPEVLAMIQQTDLLRQEAEGLALFLGRLTRSIADDAECDPTSGLDLLVLHDQSCRLSGAAVSTDASDDAEVWAADSKSGHG